MNVVNCFQFEVMGKKSDLSPRKVSNIKLLLEEECYTQSQIAARLNISQKSVSRIKNKLFNREVLEGNRIGKCGRKKILSERIARKLKNLSLSNRRSTSKDLCNNLEEYGVKISPRSVRRALNNEGLKACRPRKKQKITPSMAKKRFQWAKDLLLTEDDWAKVRVT